MISFSFFLFLVLLLSRFVMHRGVFFGYCFAFGFFCTGMMSVG